MLYNTKLKIRLTQIALLRHTFVVLSEIKNIVITFHKLGLISFIGLVRLRERVD